MASTAGQRIIRVLFMIGFTVVAWFTLSAFDQPAQADDGLPKIDPVATVEKVATVKKEALRTTQNKVERHKAVSPKPKAVARIVEKVEKVEKRVAPALKAAERPVRKTAAVLTKPLKDLKPTSERLTSSVRKVVDVPPRPASPAPSVRVPDLSAPVAQQSLALPTAMARLAAPAGFDLPVTEVRCDLPEQSRVRHHGTDLNDVSTTPSPPTSPPGGQDPQSADPGHLRDCGSSSAPSMGTVPSSWQPVIPAVTGPAPANAHTPGRSVRYNGPPS